MTLLNGTLTAYEPGPKPNPFTCPKCGNTDLEQMNLIMVDMDWCRWDYQRTDNGKPVFTYGKSVYVESADELPVMECQRIWTDHEGPHICDGEWDVAWDDFETE
jgi:hypothetical protein